MDAFWTSGVPSLGPEAYLPSFQIFALGHFPGGKECYSRTRLVLLGFSHGRGLSRLAESLSAGAES